METQSNNIKNNSLQPTEIEHPMTVISISPTSTTSFTESSDKSLLESNDDLISQEEEEDKEETTKLSSIKLQREEINKLFQEHQTNAKEGDKMFVIPTFWYDYFFNPDVEDPSLVQPIDTSLICSDYKNFILKDYNQCPYIAIPEPIFNKFVEWYGLAPNAQPAFTHLILDKETNNLVTEYNKCFFRVQYLLSPNGRSRRMNNHHVNNINYFTISCINTLSNALQEALDFFFSIESNLDIDKTPIKVWLVKDSDLDENSSHLVNTYILSPINFLSFPNVIQIQPNLLSSELRDLNISNGSFIIEVKQNNLNYHWTSNYFHYNKLGLSNGRVGLSNLGNTCYMNSALQCLTHIPQLRDYFLYNGFEKEINTENPLGYKGNIARAFHDLIQNLWANSMSPLKSSFAPNHFKTMIGHCNSMFSGYMQQDSQEFLAFLIDSLHEDLNRIIEKPYVEKPSLLRNADVEDSDIINDLAQKTWKSHLLRNDSIITDLFVGMYKSTLECPECHKVSITFDPYNDITLPLPVQSVWTAKIRLFPQSLPPCMLEVELPKTATYKDLKNYVSKCVGINASNLYGCEIFGHQFYNNFEMSDSNSQYLPLHELISESDIIIFYELPAEEDDVIVPVLNSCIESEFPSPSLFGIPFFIILKPDQLNNPCHIRKKLQDMYINLSGGHIPFNHANSEIPLSFTDFPLLINKYSSEELSKYNEIIKFAIPTTDNGKEFFRIKILDNSSKKRRNHMDGRFSQFWTPTLHINLNDSQDIVSVLDNITKDIYNYPNITEQEESQQSLSKETPESDTEPLTSKSILNDATNTDEEIMMESSDYDTYDTNAENNKSTKKNFTTNHKTESISMEKLISPTTVIVCEWLKDDIEEVFSDDKVINWENPGMIPNKELESIKLERLNQNKKQITLDDCLTLFSKKEVLGFTDSWYCPNCKEHRQATKCIQLWNTPDIMLIHLKRFENTRSFSDKIDDVVDFPITGFDISKHLVCENDPRNNIYDLIAVDNHYGGLGGGHYTAYVKNSVDDKWYYFDDSRVSIANPENSIAGSAYLLFYLRRGSLNKSSRIGAIIDETKMAYENQMKRIYTRQEYIYKSNQTDDENDSSGDEMDITEDEGALEEERKEENEIQNGEEESINSSRAYEKGHLPKKHSNSSDTLPSPTESDSEDNTSIKGYDSDNETTNNNDKIDNVSSVPTTEYSTKCQEVGHLNSDDIESVEREHIARRKIRVLNKIYPDKTESNNTTFSVSNN